MGKQIQQQVLFSEQFAYLMREGHPAAKDALIATRVRALRHVVGQPPDTITPSA
jgi:hypothetical protein